ncbi:MAG: hypothetical protein GTN69_10635 [Armatimonadetes bacterium]|nr:hypothetical protein [Armatimonadota bacterium]
MTVYAITPQACLGGRGFVSGRFRGFDGREVWRTPNDAQTAADAFTERILHGDSRMEYIALGRMVVIAVDADWNTDTWVPPVDHEVVPAMAGEMPETRRLLRDARYELYHGRDD